MINEYKILDYTDYGLPFVEVHGTDFHYLDLYNIVGMKQYMTTFNLKEGSESLHKFGQNVLGVIHYNFETNEKLTQSLTVDIDLSKIKIKSPNKNIPKNLIGDLMYEGIKVSDIEYISFLPFNRDAEYYKTGEKKVPNIVTIKSDFENIDADVIQQSYLVQKNNSGVKLAEYEKEQLIGITLGINNDRIKLIILSHLGYDKESIINNLNIRYYQYKVKENKGTLTSEEIKKFEEIKNIHKMEVLIKVCNEVIKSNVKLAENDKNIEIVQEIMNSALSFRPRTLLHGKNQIYWDLESYLHITIRHLKNFQIGDFISKTKFMYKHEDLEDLIMKVLNCVEDEYVEHKKNKPEKTFSRHGKMAILFNSDYYNLKINSDGLLLQFHKLSSKPKMHLK